MPDSDRVFTLPSDPQPKSEYFLLQNGNVEHYVTGEFDTSLRKVGTELIHGLLAGESISSGMAVIISSGQVYKFSPNAESHNGKLAGIARNAGNQGSEVVIQIAGRLSDTGYSFEESNTVFVAANSYLTTAAPQDVIIIQRIGTAISPTTLSIQIVSPIKRSL